MGFIGQRSIIEGFSEKIRNNKLSHAYALTGPAGMGKRTLAHYLSKMLLCTGTDIPCGHCRSCLGFDASTNPAFTVIRNETQKILIKQIRGLIEDISIRPASGRKVYLIEEADRMTPDAQNCLLKTLEEPPPYAILLLTTASFESLLITVRSRIVQLKLKPYDLEEMKKIVQSRGIEARGREHILSWSQGVPGKALKLLDDQKFEEIRDRVMKFVFDENRLTQLDFNQYLSKSKESFGESMDILESVYRDALAVLCGSIDVLINFDKQDKIVEYAKRCNIRVLADEIARLNEIRSNLKRNMNYQLAVDMVTLVGQDT